MLILLHVHRETHEPQFGSCVSLYCDACYVSHFDHVSQLRPIRPHKAHGSYGAIVLDHLAAHGAGLAAGQVTVVAVLQVHADLRGGLHLELIHSALASGTFSLLLFLVDIVVLLSNHGQMPLRTFA